MDDIKAQAFQNKMRLLQARYVEQVGDWSLELSDIRSAEHPWNSADYENIRMIAHKLSGSGATFGFEDISTAGAALEKMMIAGETDRMALDSAIENLVRICGAAALTDSPESPISKEVAPANDLPTDEVAARALALYGMA